ncbi:uncharacterized protein LOC127857902 [Dreissena polymorpha]|uniref:C1q domain-containing protein n=1 Tax=Dreissena polymorpha TaxID=45954 RepID=A0A9D4BX93_DREPO|nr:uncharacterized protein LOC127857902 [Dreissena polymorpha]KAH3711258.1 hypothetical protein DPMN_070760 [Dreissena polymorpha]
MLSEIPLVTLLFGIVAAGNSVESRSDTLTDRIENEHAIKIEIDAAVRKYTEPLLQELEKLNEDTRKETAVLRQDLDTLKQENALLNERFHTTKAENEKRQHHLLSVVEYIGMNQKDTIKSRKKRQPIEAVAFHAYQNSDKCIHDLQTFVYDNVLINDGNGYSANDGIFDAPVTGVYVFTWSVADFHDWYAAELVVNGMSRGATIADNDSQDIAVGTAVVVVHVQAGSHVFVRRSGGGGCNVLNKPGSATNSFSGWLLYITEP